MSEDTMASGSWPAWDEFLARDAALVARHAWCDANAATVDALMSGEMVAVGRYVVANLCGLARREGWAKTDEHLQGLLATRPDGAGEERR